MGPLRRQDGRLIRNRRRTRTTRFLLREAATYTTRKAYVIVRSWWNYNDEWTEGDDETLKAFADRAVAEAYLERCRARLDRAVRVRPGRRRLPARRGRDARPDRGTLKCAHSFPSPPCSTLGVWPLPPRHRSRAASALDRDPLYREAEAGVRAVRDQIEQAQRGTRGSHAVRVPRPGGGCLTALARRAAEKFMRLEASLSGVSSAQRNLVAMKTGRAWARRRRRPGTAVLHRRV